MAETLAPTTELDAVNTMLNNIGEAPVNSLDSNTGLDASTAQTMLREVSRQVQSRGWFWNTEITRLAPDTNSNIVLPQGTLRVRPIGLNSDKNYVYRDGKLYDRTAFANTFIFTGNIELELVYFLGFETLPENARRYIALMASRVFQERRLGVQTISQQNRMDETIAMASLRQEENANARRNVGTGSMSMSRILDRQTSRRSY